MQSPQRLVRTALLCAALALSLAGCGEGRSAAVAAPNPANAALPATVIEVAPRRVPIEVEAVGQVEGSKEVEVRARVAGILLRRSYKEGDLVSAGATMFKIDPAPFEIALAQARAQLAQEQARNDQARREAARLMHLAAEKAISQRESDDAGSNLKLSDATLQAAQARIRYEAGYSAFLEVLDAQRAANDAEQAFVRNRQLRLSASVDLMKALGGGWSADTPPLARAAAPGSTAK